MIVNLTPHPLHIYPPDTPDRIAAGSVTPLRACHRRRSTSRHGWDTR
jgi:hypothetical protein